MSLLTDAVNGLRLVTGHTTSYPASGKERETERDRRSKYM